MESDPETVSRSPIMHSRYVISSNSITKYLFSQLETFFPFHLCPVDFWCTQHNACGLIPRKRLQAVAASPVTNT